MRFADKVCLVTGGASGIGRAICTLLAAEGAKVAIVDRDANRAAETMRAITSESGQAISVHADVSEPQAVVAAVDEVVRTWGRIDILVNNASVMSYEAVVDLSTDEWDRVMNTNLRSAFLFARHSIPHMISGAIVNVSSVHAHRTTENVAPYAASKAGLEAFSRTLSIECAKRNIRVNVVAPGAVDTPMLRENPNIKSGVERLEGPIAQPGDVADVVAYLVLQPQLTAGAGGR